MGFQQQNGVRYQARLSDEEDGQCWNQMHIYDIHWRDDFCSRTERPEGVQRLEPLPDLPAPTDPPGRFCGNSPAQTAAAVWRFHLPGLQPRHHQPEEHRPPPPEVRAEVPSAVRGVWRAVLPPGLLPEAPVEGPPHTGLGPQEDPRRRGRGRWRGFAVWVETPATGGGGGGRCGRGRGSSALRRSGFVRDVPATTTTTTTTRRPVNCDLRRNSRQVGAVAATTIATTTTPPPPPPPPYPGRLAKLWFATSLASGRSSRWDCFKSVVYSCGRERCYTVPSLTCLLNGAQGCGRWLPFLKCGLWAAEIRILCACRCCEPSWRLTLWPVIVMVRWWNPKLWHCCCCVSTVISKRYWGRGVCHGVSCWPYCVQNCEPLFYLWFGDVFFILDWRDIKIQELT